MCKVDTHWHVTIHCKSATWARYGHANGGCASTVCHAPPPLARFVTAVTFPQQPEHACRESRRGGSCTPSKRKSPLAKELQLSARSRHRHPNARHGKLPGNHGGFFRLARTTPPRLSCAEWSIPRRRKGTMPPRELRTREDHETVEQNLPRYGGTSGIGFEAAMMFR